MTRHEDLVTWLVTEMVLTRRPQTPATPHRETAK